MIIQTVSLDAHQKEKLLQSHTHNSNRLWFTFYNFFITAKK